MNNIIIRDSSDSITNYLILFDLSYNYTINELREKYIKSVLKYHPDKDKYKDKYKDKDNSNINNDYFKEISNAYQILNNNLCNKNLSQNTEANILQINFKDPLTLLNEIYNNDKSNPFNSKLNLKLY